MSKEDVTVHQSRHGETRETTRSFPNWDAARGFVTAQCEGTLPPRRRVASSLLGEAAWNSTMTTWIYAYGDLEFTVEGPVED